MTSTVLRSGYMVASRSNFDGKIYLDTDTAAASQGWQNTTPASAVNTWLPIGFTSITGDPAAKLDALSAFYQDPTQEVSNGQPADDGLAHYLVVYVTVTHDTADDGTWTESTALSRAFAV